MYFFLKNFKVATKQIQIVEELDEENQVHHLKVLDRDTNEILQRGDIVPIDISPLVEYNTIIFTISADKSVWVSFDSINGYLKTEEIKEEII